jgi:hypothetical protein
MAITVKHLKVSTVPDAGDDTLVEPSDWNADHTLTGTVPVANGGTGASTLTGYVKGNGTSAMTASATVPSTDVTGLGTMSTQNANAVAITGGSITSTTVSGYIPTTEKAAALGVATLDAGGSIPLSQIPASIQGGVSYQGTWNASTNTPTLVNGVGTKGYYYVVSVAGNTNLDGITSWNVGDWAIFNGTVWQKVDNTDAVTSVNGFTGTVVLTTTDVAEGTNQYFTTARARTSVSAGTGISYDNTTGVITNASPSLGGDVVGPASATDNAIARFDTTTGKLLQNSVVTVGDTGAVTGVTTLAASTSVTTPIVQATNSAGLALRNSAGTSQISMGAGGGDNVTIAVSTNLNGTNAQIDISPTGTGHVHIKPTGVNSVEIIPTSVGKMDNVTIGATTAVAGSFTDLSVTGTTSFDGSQGTAGQVLTSAGTGATPTWTTPTTGTVTSVTGTAPVVSSGGNTPAISMAAATGSVNGYLTSTDWNTFNGKSNTNGTVTSVAALTLGTTGTDLSSTVANGTTTPVITLQVPTASAANRGALSAADWSTFNGKAPAVTYTTNYIPYGQGTTTPNQSSAFTYDGTALYLGAPKWSFAAGNFQISKTTTPKMAFRYQTVAATNDILGQIGCYSVESTGTYDNRIGAYINFVATNTPNFYQPTAITFGTNSSRDADSTAERMRIHSSGGVSIGNTTDPSATNLSVTGTGKFGTTVGVGAATPSTSGAGITFPATQSASTDVNTLDDYEEGTWTPTYTTDGTNFTSVSYDVQSATYTKIGRVVTVTFTIATGSITAGAATGNVMIGGLPFTTGSTGRTGVGFLRGQSINYPFQVNAPSFTGSESGATKFYLFVGTNQYLVVTDMKTIGTGNLVAGTLTYIST